MHTGMKESQKNGFLHRPSFFYNFTSVTGLDSLKSQTNTHCKKNIAPHPHISTVASPHGARLRQSKLKAELNDSKDKAMRLCQL